MSDARVLPLIEKAVASADRCAIHAQEGEFTYGDLLAASARVASTLQREHALLLLGTRPPDDGAPALQSNREQAPDLREARVAFMITPGFAHVAVQWGIWRAGGIAVPLALSHPPPELAYVMDDAGAGIVVADGPHAERLRPLAEQRRIRLLTTDALLPQLIRDGDPSTEELVLGGRRGALLVYTSGTTSRPKGAVITHDNLEAQTSALREAWGWQESDHILCTLPLHHVHGIVNVLTCALRSGARCTILPGFNAQETWRTIEQRDLTLFMAVPTIYVRLIAAWEAAPAEVQQRWSTACRRMRLMVSGSAALPVNVLQRWREISGHTLLERYGMTEIGMALSNPLHGERRPGFVGTPLPGVDVRLVDENGNAVPAGMPGEIEVRGRSVFREYWRRPEATRAAFRNGWFRTGDVAVMEHGAYRILGRSSTDIIKSGGYKVSALEIEEVLRTNDAVLECAVVGVADEQWGECVCAAVVQKNGATTDADMLRTWAKEQLAPYKVPTRITFVEDLPRNAMGKVIKPDVAKLFDTS